MIYFFFCSYTATRGPSPFLYGSTFLTYLLKIYWAIQQELFTSFLPKIKKIQKDRGGVVFVNAFFFAASKFTEVEPQDEYWDHILMYISE